MCRACKVPRKASKWLCLCGVPWHTCHKHRQVGLALRPCTAGLHKGKQGALRSFPCRHLTPLGRLTPPDPPTPRPGETQQRSKKGAQGPTKRTMELATPPPKRIRRQSWREHPTSHLMLEVGPRSQTGARNPPMEPMGSKRRRLAHGTRSDQVDPRPTPSVSLRYLEYVRRGTIQGTPETGGSQQAGSSIRPCAFTYQ